MFCLPWKPIKKKEKKNTIKSFNKCWYVWVDKEINLKSIRLQSCRFKPCSWHFNVFQLQPCKYSIVLRQSYQLLILQMMVEPSRSNFQLQPWKYSIVLRQSYQLLILQMMFEPSRSNFVNEEWMFVESPNDPSFGWSKNPWIKVINTSLYEIWINQEIKLELEMMVEPSRSNFVDEEWMFVESPNDPSFGWSKNPWIKVINTSLYKIWINQEIKLELDWIKVINTSLYEMLEEEPLNQSN